jgi:hypothetical protein
VAVVGVLAAIRALPREEARAAALAALRRRPEEAESILVQAGLVYRAIKMHVRSKNWDRSDRRRKQGRLHSRSLGSGPAAAAGVRARVFLLERLVALIAELLLVVLVPLGCCVCCLPCPAAALRRGGVVCRALEVAIKHKSHVDTVLWYRAADLAASGQPEYRPRFLQYAQQVEVNEEQIRLKIAQEKEREKQGSTATAKRR